MPEILMENITKYFDDGKITAVANVNVTIQDGEYVFILGPSGCGKTTLLRMISGLTTPSIGDIFINRRKVTQESPQSRGIAFVFQHFEIFPLSVWENATYALRVRGYPENFIKEQGEQALKKVGLLDRANEIPDRWGNGDLQRLGLARAIASMAQILIMDEPLGSLDPKISTEFRWELRNIIKENHLTAIQVTHNQEEAMSIGDRIIIMREGKLLQQDTPEQLYNYPNSIFVGNFLGGLNILEGYIRQIQDYNTFEVKCRLGGPHFKTKVSKNSSDRYKLDENVIIGFRFEDVYLFPNDYNFKDFLEKWEDINIFQAEVIDTFLTGKELFFIIELDNGDQIHASKPEIFRFRLRKGEKLKAGIFTDEINLFKYPKNLQKELDLQ